MPAGRTRELEDAAPSSGEDESEKSEHRSCIVWTGGSRKIPILIFRAETILTKDAAPRLIGERYHLGFKIVRTDSRLVRSILGAHGFQEVPQNSNDFNLLWTGSHLKPYLMRSLLEYQKVNHFPRSYEITRKDRLYKNVQRMQQNHGFKNFHFLPQTFMLPAEYQEFCNAFAKDRGPWIVKPVASSRGRGVYLVNSPHQISLEDNILVSRYINQPLLIDDFKFDVRLYVLVTSYDPLVIYLYEEGLARFATVRYDKTPKNIKNQFMHLTNYSVNKKSGDYVSCDDPEVEDYGNKWSMSAMLRYLKQEGRDTAALMAHVEDLIIKAVISAELSIATACKTFVPHRGVCFELYGFDVLIDSGMKPWLLEVNLSPSLACDAPLDLKVKASMLSDMFTLVGLVCHDPTQRSGRNATTDSTKRNLPVKPQRQRPLSASDADVDTRTASIREKTGKPVSCFLGLSTEEMKTLRRVNEEWERRGSFIRIFPRADTWDLYGPYLEFKTSMNYVLSTHLFTDRGSKGTVAISRVRSLRDGSMEFGISSSYPDVKLHAALYERKLLSLEMRKRRRRRPQGKPRPGLVQRKGTSKSTAAPHKVELEIEDEEESTEDDDSEEIDETSCIPSVPPQKPAIPAQYVPTEHTASLENPQKDQVHSQQKGIQRQSSPETHPINLMKALKENCNLSKVQARMAFSAYLQQVRDRLNTEIVDQSQNDAWAAKEDEQMDLVVRFLKRAAANLQQSLKMVLPGRRLPLMDRRRILAYQLGQFVHYYNQETEHMVQKDPMTDPKEHVENELNPEQFRAFVKHARESELEEILTFYTQKNKSTSVFLGTNSRTAKTSKTSNDSIIKSLEDSREKLEPIKENSAGEERVLQSPVGSQEADIPIAVKKHKTMTAVTKDSRVAHSLQPSLSSKAGHKAGNSPLPSHSVTHDYSLSLDQQLPLLSTFPSGSGHFTGNPLVQVPSSTSSPSPGQADSPGHWAYPLALDSSQASNPEKMHRSRSGIMTSASVSSLRSAAQIYSQRLYRPSSAKAVSGQQTPNRDHSITVGHLKDREDTFNQSTTYNHNAVATALQQLVEKQTKRQYSTSSHLGLLTQQLTNMNLASGALNRTNGPSIASNRPSTTTGGPMRALHSDTQENRVHTPPRIRHPEISRWPEDGDMGTSAYSIVTGVSPQQKYQPTASSYQLQYAMQQLELQRLQGRQLLEQSRARQQVLFPDQQQPGSKSLPENSNTQWTAHRPSSSQNTGGQRATFGQSSTQHTPKPPVNHKQFLLRKTAPQRTSRVSNVDGQPGGHQNSVRSTSSTEDLTSYSGSLVTPGIIFARCKAEVPSTTTSKRKIAKIQTKALQAGTLDST